MAEHVDSEAIESVEGEMLGNGPVCMIAVWLEVTAEAVEGTLAMFADDCHWCTLGHWWTFEVTGHWESEHSNWGVLHVHNMFTIAQRCTQTY